MNVRERVLLTCEHWVREITMHPVGDFEDLRNDMLSFRDRMRESIEGFHSETLEVLSLAKTREEEIRRRLLALDTALAETQEKLIAEIQRVEQLVLEKKKPKVPVG